MDIAMKKILIPVFLLLLAACSSKQDVPAENNQQEEAPIPIRTTSVKSMTESLPVHGGGILSSTGEQRLAFKIGGIVRKIYVDEGDAVRAGQLLAVLDKTEIDAQVNQAKEALAKSERDLARVEGLYRDSSATLELLQNATTGRDVAKETVKIAVFNQQFAEIRAVRSGKIIKKLANEGEVIGPGMPAFVVFETGPSDWVVRVHLSDRDWARLEKGASAKVRFDAYGGEPFSGKVSDLAAAADPASGLYPVEIKVAPGGKKFAPGLFGNVDITPGKPGTYRTVPIEAVVEGDGMSAYVFALQPDGQSVKKQPVRVAFLEGKLAIISDGLESVAEVVTEGAPYLSEKKKVRKVE